MIKYSKRFLFIYKAILYISFFLLLNLISIKFFYLFTDNDYIKYYINHEIEEKRYIEYYQKIEIIPKNSYYYYKVFAYREYDLFCYCKNNTNYRVYDKNYCLYLKECEPFLHFIIDNYELKYLSNWKNNIIKYNKKIYYFYQGINNKTQNCDINYNYKKCGYLIDLNTDFCVKENEACPFNDTNIRFYLNNLTNNIILISEDKKAKLVNDYEIQDFFPDLYEKKKEINYEIIDSINLVDLILNNKIPYLREKINENMSNLTLDLALLKLDNSSIKYNENYFKEKIVIGKYSKVSISFKIIFWVNILIAGFCFCDVYYRINKEVLNSNEYRFTKEKIIIHLVFFLCKFCTTLYLIINLIFFYKNNKKNIDKEYIFNKEYYSLIKEFKKIFIYIILLFFIAEYPYILVLIQHCKCKCNYCKRRNNVQQFVEIQ